MAKVNFDPVEDAYKKKNAAIDAAAEANRAAYDAQREDLADGTGDALQQAYIQRNRARKMLAQQNKAAGITGGAAESSLVALEVAYDTNRTNAKIQRDKQISQIDIAQRQAEGQAEIEKAANNIELESGKLSFKQDENTSRRSELWEMVKSGVITQEIAAELGWPVATLQQVYERGYKES